MLALGASTLVLFVKKEKAWGQRPGSKEDSGVGWANYWGLLHFLHLPPPLANLQLKLFTPLHVPTPLVTPHSL